MSARYSEGTLNQRDQSRTQLFGNIANSDYNETPVSAYNSKNNSKSSFDYSQSKMAQLESQSNEEMSKMGEKIQALKSLSLRMGDEIRGSNKTLDNLGETFENTTLKLKNTFSNMMSMAKNSKISLKAWLGIFAIVALLFFWVWIT